MDRRLTAAPTTATPRGSSSATPRSCTRRPGTQFPFGDGAGAACGGPTRPALAGAPLGAARRAQPRIWRQGRLRATDRLGARRDARPRRADACGWSRAASRGASRRSIRGSSPSAARPGGLTVVEAPRYAQFTELLRKLSRARIELVEIAGNDEIFLTVLAPRQCRRDRGNRPARDAARRPARLAPRRPHGQGRATCCRLIRAVEAGGGRDRACL